MPTISLDTTAIEKQGIPREDIEHLIDRLGMSVEKLEDTTITIEITPNRPDLLEVNGLCRALRFISGKHTPKEDSYVLKNPPCLKIVVGSRVRKSRPFVGGVVAKGIDLSGTKLKELINFEEKLAETYGRDRKKMAIGMHSLKAIKGDLRYDAAEKGRMVPLGESKELEFYEIIKGHKKGQEYSEIIDSYGVYPCLSDKEKVIALVPISSSELTKVTEATKDVFIDITGTSKTTVEDTANIIASLLLDMGVDVYPCEILYEKTKKSEIIPLMQFKEMRLGKSKAENALGILLDETKVISMANKMGYTAAKYGSKILFFVPPYRVDVIAEQDLIEDIAIAYGYDKINPTPIYSNSVGLPEEFRTRCEGAATIMIGLGFTEAMNMYLTNEKTNFEMMNRSEVKSDYVSVAYAKTESISMLRTSILPSLMSNLSASVNVSMPQKLFETGNVFSIVNGKPKEGFNIGLVIEHSRSNFSEVKSAVLALCMMLGSKNITLKEEKDPAFIEGRCASIIINGTKMGVFGEIHPKILKNFKLEEPVAAAELDLSYLFSRS